MKPLLVAVMGPTASGKTALAEGIADKLQAKLINADTFQCYRHLDIGTAKPERTENYALIDIADPTELLGVGEWVKRADATLDRSQNAVIVGGSGLNIRALLEGYGEMHGPPPAGLRERLNATPLPELVAELNSLDAAVAEKVDIKNPVRVTRAIERFHSQRLETAVPDLSAYRIVKFGLDASQQWLSNRISRRTHEMIQMGWLDEVAKLRSLGFKASDPGMKAHGYRSLWEVLEGTKTLEDAEEEISIMVRQYAKRQRTWLRAEPNLCKIWAEDGRRSIESVLSHLSKAGCYG
ncbi:MAG: tRNA (adenosine(37)-N6)-dimethylallyltransferase MiaA [Fimbriimonadaceae bacterium]